MSKRSKNRRAGHRGARRTSVSLLPSLLRRGWFLSLSLGLAVVLVYLPLWRAGFIWDDDAHVTRLDLRSWQGLGRIWFDLGATQQFYPLVHSFFWVQHKFWGDRPLGYHLVNILLHALSAALLFKILRRLEVPGAWLAAAIWALHPVQVESVAWASELKNMLSGFFYFSSALVYLEYDRTRKREAHGLSLTLFVLGLLSKTVIASLPAALLVVFWWKRGRLSWKRDVQPLAPFFIAGISSGLLTSWVERHFGGAEGANFNFTLIDRTLIAGRAIWFYLGKLVWPSDLAFIYPRWHVDAAVWWQYLFPVAALLVAATLVWLSPRWRGPLAGFLFFAVTLFPALGYFNVYPFLYSFVADHFQYLACLGVIVPCAAGMARLARFFLPEKPRLRAFLAAGLLLVLATLSWQRTWAYTTEETLWNDTLARNPDCWMAHNNLGKILEDQGRLDEAIAQFQKVLELKPASAQAHTNLAGALLHQGRVDDAIALYQKALEIEPASADVHYNLGTTLLRKGRLDEAVAQFQEALEINPSFTKAFNNLGWDLQQMGRVDEAIDQFQSALEIDPNFASAHNNLGHAYLQKGQIDDAIVEFQEVVRLNPGDSAAQANLAKAQAMAQPGAAGK